MTKEEKRRLELQILYALQHNDKEKITTQSQLINTLTSMAKRANVELPIECTQSQISKLLKEFNIIKIDGTFKQIKNKKLYDYFHEHSYIFDNDKKAKDIITFTNENIIHIKLKNDVAKEGCRLINEAFDFKVIAHSSYKVITIFSVDENMLSFFDEIDKININSKFHDYYEKDIKNKGRH